MKRFSVKVDTTLANFSCCHRLLYKHFIQNRLSIPNMSLHLTNNNEQKKSFKNVENCCEYIDENDDLEPEASFNMS